MIIFKAFVLLLCLAATWAAPGKKSKRGLTHGHLASGSLEVGGGHLDIPPVPSLPLEGEIHSSASAFAGTCNKRNLESLCNTVDWVLGASSFASAGAVGASFAAGPGLPIAASGPDVQVASGPGVSFAAGGPAIGVGPAGALGGPDLHSAEPHYHLGHTVQRHVTVLHRIGVPVPRPYQVQVERRVPVQVCA